MSSSTYSDAAGLKTAVPARPLLANLALVGLISTILLIAVGSFVRVTGHGLGCPDWPLCYGRVLPPLKIGAWVEFSHRLLGGVVGLQIGALAFLAWRQRRQEKWILYPALAAIVVLVIQVSLGGLHVINELPRWTGLVHTGVAMLIAGLLAVVVTMTQPALLQIGARTAGRLRHTRLPLWTSLAAGATYALLLTGSLVTRTGASLVCPAFPHCGLAQIPDFLSSYVTIQMLHRYSAFTVAVAILALVWYLLRAGRQDSGLRRFTIGLIFLLIAQFSLGISNVLLSLPMWSRVLHLAVGGTIWVTLLMLAVILYHGRQQLARSHL